MLGKTPGAERMIMTTILNILVPVLVFGAVIFVHELGHFFVAKRCGIKVNEFAMGMGPAIFKRTVGETQYSLRLFPIGGFVLMEGEEEASQDSRAFNFAPIPKRMLVMVAGAFMNLVLAFVAMLVLVASSPYPIASLQIAQVQNTSTGLQEGDVIHTINGRRAFVYSDLDYEFLRTQNGTFSLKVKRDGKIISLEDITFPTQIAYDETTKEPIINPGTEKPYEYLDIGFKVWGLKKTPISAVKEAFFTTLSNSRLIYLSLMDLMMGRTPVNQLSGPVGIVKEISNAVSLGWRPVVHLLSFISVNLGVMNMLPLPALDGGKTALLLLEAIRKKPLNQKYEMAINFAGFALLIGLMIFASVNDVRRIFF